MVSRPFLLPLGTAPYQVQELFEDLSAQLEQSGLVLAGGHTEITDAVTRILVSGCVLGVVSSEEMLRKANMAEGEALLLVGSAGMEGTGVLAAEFSSRLTELGMTSSELEEAAEFENRLSVLPVARITRRFGGVSAMHDVKDTRPPASGPSAKPSKTKPSRT